MLQQPSPPFARQPGAPVAAAPPGPQHYVLGLMLALAGGVAGIIGAFFQELRSGLWILLPFIGAPIIEEALKPAGIYVLVGYWRRIAWPQLYIASLTALSGVAFGLIESTLYVKLYVDDAPSWFAEFRYTVPVAMHGIASFIAGLGINQQLIEWANRGDKFPVSSRNAFVAAIALHALYNTATVALAFAGAFD